MPHSIETAWGGQKGGPLPIRAFWPPTRKDHRLPIAFLAARYQEVAACSIIYITITAGRNMYKYLKSSLFTIMILTGISMVISIEGLAVCDVAEAIAEIAKTPPKQPGTLRSPACTDWPYSANKMGEGSSRISCAVCVNYIRRTCQNVLHTPLDMNVQLNGLMGVCSNLPNL